MQPPKWEPRLSRTKWLDEPIFEMGEPFEFLPPEVWDAVARSITTRREVLLSGYRGLIWGAVLGAFLCALPRGASWLAMPFVVLAVRVAYNFITETVFIRGGGIFLEDDIEWNFHEKSLIIGDSKISMSLGALLGSTFAGNAFLFVVAAGAFLSTGQIGALSPWSVGLGFSACLLVGSAVFSAVVSATTIWCLGHLPLVLALMRPPD